MGSQMGSGWLDGWVAADLPRRVGDLWHDKAFTKTFIKDTFLEVLLRCRGLRIRHCLCSSSSHC